VLANGKVLVVGGSAGTTTNTAELYDPTTNTWSATGALTWARDSHTATLSATGKVLVTGGRANGTTTSTAELYDPGTGQWSSVSSLSEARIWHTATLLPGGKVFVAGGNGDGSALRLGSAAVYESSLANTWSSANGTMTEARDWHTATLLTTGKVLVAGGYGAGGFLQGAELYDPGSGDPSQGTWSTTGALTTARREHAATLLTDGTVLVTGGLGTGNLYLQSAELYDPGAGTWSSVNALFAPLKRHTSTVLNDGRVLVTGGHNSTGVLNTVQLYSP
jgi:N-acetylneuraminic acid mutarotase